MDSITSLRAHDIDALPISPRPCETCGDLVNQLREPQDVKSKRFSSIFNAARQPGVSRRASTASFSRSGFADALRRLRRGSSVVQEDAMSCRCMYEARIAAPTIPTTIPEHDNVYTKALKAAGGLVSMQRQSGFPGSGGSSPPHKRNVRVYDINPNAKRDSQCGEDAQINGAVGAVSSRRFETAVAPRRCAPTPDFACKHRSTYSVSGEHASSEDASDESLETHDNMAVEMAANMADLRSDLEWLEPIATFNRNVEIRNAGGTQDKVVDNLQESSNTMHDATQCKATTNIDDLCDQNVIGSQSPPELDAGYQTSDSGLSAADELTPEDSTPAQSMLEILSKNVDGRFGSFYSVSNQSVIPEPQIHEMDFAYPRPDLCRSRFSWGSSVYSDDIDSTGDSDRWWKPKPLVINKETAQPPPIPEKNPLRLLRRLSKGGPKGSSENVRATRNIHNLQLDLSKLTKEDLRGSTRNSKSSRRRSHNSGSKHTPKHTGNETEPRLALPGHILDAMRSAAQHNDAPAKSRNRKKTRQSSKSNSTSTAHSRSQSATEVISGSTYAQQLMSARGHVRAVSDPIRQTSSRRSDSCRWSETMPADEPIRRTCIASLTNEHKSRRPAAALAINKQLPPLPWMVELSQKKGVA
jgi:hypothetical protein